MIALERAIMTKLKSAGLALAIAVALPGAAQAETLKVITAGAFKQVLLAVIPQFQASGHDIKWENDTVGNLIKRIDAGESFDLVIASPAALDTLGKSGKVAGGAVDLAKVGVGVAVREGAAKPDISSVDAFKQALLAAKGVAYIDPASGGTSGIYVAGLIDTLGIGSEIRQKAVLVPGGAAADRVTSGDAELAIHQISEILPVKGVVLVGPLPPDLQKVTVYSAGLAARSAAPGTARAFIAFLTRPAFKAKFAAAGLDYR